MSTGDCVVDVTSYNGKVHNAVRLIDEGEHFGEISTIFNCLVSATVISRNYNIMARITQDRFKEFAIEFPDYKDVLKKRINRYKDPKINFLKKTIRSVYLFKEISDLVMTDLLYQMTPKYYNKGDFICKCGEVGDTLLILEKGEIDIKTEMEGNEFMIDRLIPGTVINYRTFLLEDDMDVDLICVSGCKILEMPFKKLELIMMEHPEFEISIKKHQQKILNQSIEYPLDYTTPPDIQKQKFEKNF